MTSSDNFPNTVEDYVVKFDPVTGRIIDEIDYRSILQRTRIFGLYYDVLDWMHMNSVMPIDDDLIISSNYQSSIVRNDWDGNIQWILGNDEAYPESMKELFLSPISDNFSYPYNQHAAEVIGDLDNNPNTLYLLVFDNGSNRNAVEGTYDPLVSRVLHYRIDEVQKTVQEIFSYGEDRPELFSAFRGDVDLLK